MMFGMWTVSNTEKIHSLFPVPLYWWRPDPVTRHGILQEFAAQVRNIDAGLAPVLQHEYERPRHTDEYAQTNSSTTYHLTRASAFVDQCVREYVRLLGYGDSELECERMWFNRVDQGDSHIWHSHGNSLVSGTLYYRVPEGDIEFRTPNPFARAGLFPVKDQWCPVAARTPQPGDIGLWPSYLEHRVTPNNSLEPRYAMSFDYVAKRG